MAFPPRREFFKHAAGLLAAAASWPLVGGRASDLPGTEDHRDFSAFQEKRRKELWGLLGDLPWPHKPGAPKLVKKEKHDGYTLERLVLDPNGFEPVPGLLLIPEKRQTPAPALLFIHWHGGMYDLGKEELLVGVDAQPAYAPVCAEIRSGRASYR